MGDILQELLDALDGIEPTRHAIGNVRAGDARERIRELIDREDRATDRLASLEETLRRLAFKLVQASDDGGEFRNLDTSETLAKVGEELHAIRKDHTVSPFLRENAPSRAEGATGTDGLDALALALYGRKARPREYIGGSDAAILHDAAKALCVKDPTAFARSATQPESLSPDDAATAELWGMLVAMIGHGQTVEALTDHELAAKLEGGLADLPVHSREYALIESLLARLDRADGGVCEGLDGQSDPAFRKARVCDDCENMPATDGMHCALFTAAKLPSECPAWKRRKPGMKGKRADAVLVDEPKAMAAPRCTCGCDGVIVKHKVCAWPECGERATHVRPMCGGLGSFVDVPLCAEHFEAMKLGPHANISIGGKVLTDLVPDGVRSTVELAAEKRAARDDEGGES